MQMRGNTPPTTRSPPHQSCPTGNPPNRQPAQSPRKNGAGEARRRVGRRRGRPPSADRHRPRGTRHHSAPATDTPQQHDAPHSAHLHKRPTLPETRTQPATGTDRRTPTTRRHSAWASPGRRTQTATREACFKCGDMKALAVYILVLLFTCCALPLPLLLVLHIIFTFKCDYTSSERILT